MRSARTPTSPGRYPTPETTDLTSALAALTTWLRDGCRDPELTWHAETRHEEVVRPPALEATD